jgi:hypothetical protein
VGRKRGVQYRDGSFYRVDDRSGFTVRAEHTKEEWQDLIVARGLWEPRQPQDLVKGIIDDQTVPQPRSEATNRFVGPIYIQITADIAVGATFVPLQTLRGVGAGDNVGIMMDNGVVFTTQVNGDPVPAGVNITGAIPFPVSSGNLFTDYEGPGP